MSVASAAPKTVLFLCPHGGAKSLIAASYFNRIAQARQLPFQAIAAAAEDPYPEVPANVAETLGREGFDVRGFRPRPVAARDFGAAEVVITIDCDLPAFDTRSARVDCWDDVPKVSVDLEGSRAAIRRHVQTLADELAAQIKPR